MPRTHGFRVLVATDGSTSARVAATAAGMYPWPRGAEVHGVVAHWFAAAEEARVAAALPVDAPR